MDGVEIMQISDTDSKRIYEASELIWRVFEEFESKEFTEYGVGLFKKFIDPLEICKNMQEGYFDVRAAICNGVIVGVICMRDNHIALLFVDKNFHRRKIGRRLVDSFFNELKDADYRFVSVNSSPYGESFYKAMGFVPTDDKQAKNGIVFTPMRLEL